MGFWKKKIGKKSNFPILLYRNWILQFLWGRMSLWRHRSQILGMLVLNLVSMFRGHSKLTIGTKINIIQGFALIFFGGVVTTPSLVVRVTKKPLVGRGLKTKIVTMGFEPTIYRVWVDFSTTVFVYIPVVSTHMSNTNGLQFGTKCCIK